MNKNLAPKTTLGKWTIGLNAFFLIVVAASVFLAKVIRVLSFDDHWWDVTVAVVFPMPIIALFTGIIVMIKKKDRSALVLYSVILSALVVLFILFHSLFISD
jgi:hypothetical protein